MNLETNHDLIAIVGMDCRLPGASNTGEFWENLVNGVESIREFTKEELLEAGVPREWLNDPKYVPRRGIVDGVDKFDASFFGFTPREAELLDPQHRLFLETCWHALEDAGYARTESAGRIGVFGGAGTAWYLNDVYGNPKVKKYADPTSIVTASDKDYLTTRVSYKLNLSGPSLDVQSACSSSMASIILGIQSLLNYQSDMILAGGVSAIYPEKRGYLYAPGSLESKDGHCRPFDKDASGTAFSRGCGVVLLKRYEEAVQDGDHIYAVIRGGAINNDGNKKLGFTAPSVEGQKEVILEAIELAGVTAEEIFMVEAHGTATPVGDPIEVSSLSEAFRVYTDKKQYCALGSVKSNIGHTDAAAGVVAVIKTALSLQNRKVPASINYKEPNPKIEFESSPFFVNTELRSMPENEKVLALVNSFGVGGTNACLVMETPPEQQAESTKRKHEYYFLPVSAREKETLNNYIQQIEEFVNQRQDLNVYNLAFSALAGRKHFKHRAFVSYCDRDDLLEKLDSGKAWKKSVAVEDKRPLVFMFPGQGNQYLKMGYGLYEKYEAFRNAVDRCAGILQKEMGMDIREVIFAEPNDDKASGLIDQTFVTQPALFVISYAQAELLRSWGIEPDLLMGHSVGEYVAATLAGIFSLEDALTAVARRGKLIQDLPGGAMCAVMLSEEDVLPLLGPASSIGALNYPGLSVVSGPYEEIEVLESKLSEKKVFNKRIPTSHAFHSAMMDQMLPDFRSFFEHIRLHVPEKPVYSTVTGQLLTGEEATSVDYWVNHVRRTVRFSDAVQAAMAAGDSVFMEVGPGQSLESAVKRHLGKESGHSVLSSMRTNNSDLSDTEYLTNALGLLWSFGNDLDAERLFEGEEPKRIPFPLYPYNRKKYIIEPVSFSSQTEEEDQVREDDVGNWVFIPTWEKTASLKVLLSQQNNSESGETNQETKEQAINNWLIFENDLGMGERLARAFKEQHNEEVVLVYADKSFEKKDDHHFTIRPGEEQDYKKLLADLSARELLPNRVIHLWNVDKKPEFTPSQNGSLKHEIQRMFYSPLYLEKALMNENVGGNVRILFVSNGTFSIGAEPIVNPLKSLLIGPVKVIYPEFNLIRARMVDLEAAFDVEKAVEMLYREALYDTKDLLVAYRRNSRWLENFRQVYYPRPDEELKLFEENGYYLITGGTGGLGLEFARHIASFVKANLVLTYRSNMPDRKDWDSYVQETPEDYIAERIKSIQEIESMGSRVYLVQARVDDYEQMKKVHDFIFEKTDKLEMVIHSAGTPGGGVIALKTEEMAEDVLRPKVHGTLILNELFGDKTNQMVYFSSISAVLPEASRVDYSSANNFMDSMAAYCNQQNGGSVVSLNWDSWNKVGMAARWKETQAISRKRMFLNEKSDVPGLHLISSENGEEIYQLGFNEQNRWVYNQHVIMKKDTFVGTFFLNMLLELARIKFKGKVPEVTGLYFMKPVFLEKHDIPIIRFYVTPEGRNYRVRIMTLTVDQGRDIWEEAVSAIIQGSDELPPPSRTLEEITRGLTELQKKDFGDETSVNVGGEERIRYSKRWKSLKRLFKDNNLRYVLVEHLGEDYLSDLEHFIVHPAVLDAAIIPVIKILFKDLYLPFNYQSARLYKPFTAKVFVEVVIKEPPAKEQEMAAFDLNVYDESGEPVLRVTNYSLINMSKKINAQMSEAGKEVQSGANFMMPKEAVEVFDRILFYKNESQVVVSPLNVNRSFRDMLAEKQEIEIDADDVATYERPEISTEYVEPQNEIEETIAKIWGQILGIGQIGINDAFGELGGNSLLVVQAVSNISGAFEIELPVTVFKESTTVKELAEYVMGMLMEGIDEAELDALLNETD